MPELWGTAGKSSHHPQLPDTPIVFCWCPGLCWAHCCRLLSPKPSHTPSTQGPCQGNVPRVRLSWWQLCKARSGLCSQHCTATQWAESPWTSHQQGWAQRLQPQGMLPPCPGSGSSLTSKGTLRFLSPVLRSPAEVPGTHDPARTFICHMRCQPRGFRGQDAFIKCFCPSRHRELLAGSLHSLPCFICTDVFAKACHQPGEGAVEKKNKNNKNDRTSWRNCKQ